MKQLIQHKGFYKSNRNDIWYWDGWSNNAVITLINIKDKDEKAFFRDGFSVGLTNTTKIIIYLGPDSYPELYL